MSDYNSNSKTVFLVSCTKRKLSGDKLHPAQAIYLSAWFDKARAFVEASNCCPWYILSAKYGLLDHRTLISTYDKTLNTMPAHERKRWAQNVYVTLTQKFGKPEQQITFVILAGQKYRQYLVPFMNRNRTFTVYTPLAHLGIGSQLAWLGNNLAHAQSLVENEFLWQSRQTLTSITT